MALGLVAVGRDLSPPTLLAAYRAGAFPWPDPDRPRVVPWFSPDPRAVLRPDAVHVSRTLRARMRRCGWTTTVDRAFGDVVARCAERPVTWITPALRAGYAGLHAAGHAHSVEVWDADARLVGGVYGIQVGGVFSGESMFHAATDASKVALVDLAARLAAGGAALIDVQQATPHLVRLGAVLVPRAEYLAVLHTVRDAPIRLPAEPAAVARLADRDARAQL